MNGCAQHQGTSLPRYGDADARQDGVTPSSVLPVAAEAGEHMPLADALRLAEARIQELEIRSTLADDMLDQMNQVVFRMQRQIEVLQREILDLRSQSQEGSAVFRSLRDELPPHY